MKLSTAYIPDQELNGLFDLRSAFLNGTVFKNLYDPYHKKFNYNLPNTDQLLKNIQAIGFVLLDIGMFLDTHPNNREALALYKEYNNKYTELVNMYEKTYGPLTLTSNTLGEYPWSWINAPWPWEVGI